MLLKYFGSCCPAVFVENSQTAVVNNGCRRCFSLLAPESKRSPTPVALSSVRDTDYSTGDSEGVKSMPVAYRRWQNQSERVPTRSCVVSSRAGL